MRYSYESLAEAADAAEARHDGFHSNGRELENGDPTSTWCFGVTFSQALEMARYGWSEQLQPALDIAESAVAMADREHMTDTFSPVWDVSGATVDVARYLSGEPECMIDFPLTRTSNHGRVITLVASVDWSGVVKAENILKRGQLIVALVVALTHLGHAVELWVDAHGNHDKHGKTSCEISIKVKGVDDEIDPAAIMFAYAHPAILRRIVFGIREKSCHKSHIPARAVASLYPEGSIILPEVKSKKDVPDADTFLRQYLGELGLLAE